MAVKEIFVPVGAIRCVCELSVEAHYGRKELAQGEDYETGNEGVVYRCSRRCGIFALAKKHTYNYLKDRGRGLFVIGRRMAN